MRSLTLFVLLIVAIANVTAVTSQKADQCTTAATNAIQTLCQASDQACQAALSSVGDCLTKCASGTDQSDAYVLKCVKTTCTTTNSTVQSWLNKFVSCLNLSKLTFSILLLALFALIF